MADGQQLALLRQGTEAWNAWRKANPGVDIDLTGADLTGAALERANLSHARLAGARLFRARLKRASLAFADLSGAVLTFADLTGADLRVGNLAGVSAEDTLFRQAKLDQADLSRAKLGASDFFGAGLTGTVLHGADLRGANLENAKIARIDVDRHILLKTLRQAGLSPKAVWRRRRDILLDTTMRCRGINVCGCHGSIRLVRYLQDQDYFEEFFETARGRILFFFWWLVADCGRSILRWTLWSALFALAYACLYHAMGARHFEPHILPFNMFTMIYYSGMTITTLGSGDILPQTNLAAMLVLSEVCLGYVLLGGLITIFAGKLARRGD